MSDMTAEPSSPAELPRAKTDWLPLLLVPALALLALPFVGSPSTWVTLTVAGLAMGMMIFLMASGLTLVFGLMDIINFGHGVFISLGAYATLLVLGPLAGWATADSLGLNLALLLLCILAAMALTGVVGAVFERVIVRPVYGSHLKQILVTMGGLIVTEQLIHAIWGASPIP
ncbi:MAG: ABC transporter permease subunit, partial [Microvirga sp.]